MSGPPADQTVFVGVAGADITPPVGIKSVGFAARGPLTKFHDPLVATALVFAEGDQQIVLISCDLLGLDAETVGELRSQIGARCGTPPGNVTVACTHTHYGPDAYRAMSDPLVSAYRANLVHILAGLVEEAKDSQVAAHLGVGWGESDIGVNRREKLPDGRVILGQNLAGPIDRSVGVLRVDDVSGSPMACVVNFATHPVSQGSQVDHISADYPGRMRQVVEALTGTKCLFLQGACGNINAAIMGPSYEPAWTLGTRLGCEVVRVWETIQPRPQTGLGTASTVAELPAIRYASEKEAVEVVEAAEHDLERLRSRDGAAGWVSWAERRLLRARQAVNSWQTGVPAGTVEAELQAWHVGDFALAAAPGEIFVELGMRVRSESPFRNTFFVGYANGSIGYVPVPEAYPDGGYEVLRASQVDPGAAQLLTDGSIELLQKLKGTFR
jgi:hypothetical protein